MTEDPQYDDFEFEAPDAEEEVEEVEDAEEDEEALNFEDCASWRCFEVNHATPTRRMFNELIGFPADVVDIVWMRVVDKRVHLDHEAWPEANKVEMLHFLWLLYYMRVHPTLQQAAFAWKICATRFRHHMTNALALVMATLGKVRFVLVSFVGSSLSRICRPETETNKLETLLTTFHR